MPPLLIDRVAVLSFYALGIRATIEDIQRSKIANKWIAAGLWVGALSCVYLALNTFLGLRQTTFLNMGVYYLPADFYPRLLRHCLSAFAAALCVWYLKLWPAGDAKLYMALSLLLPLADHNLHGFPNSLFLAALVNIFVLAGLYVIGIVAYECLLTLKGLSRPQLREHVHSWLDRTRIRISDEWPKRYNYLTLSWNTYVLFLIFRTARTALRLPSSWGMAENLAVYFALYLLWNRLRSWLIRKETTHLSLCAASLVVLLGGIWFRSELVLHFFKSGQLTAGFGVFLSFATSLVKYYLGQTRILPTSADELLPGMILSDESWKILERETGAGAPPRYPDGLSLEEIALIKTRHALRPLTDLAVHSPRPFAFWVFAGCLWTLYSKQNVAQCLISRLSLP